ncbi:hypothetical protein GCK32_010206 [Trichostrongylus colubriformis]|uniref:Abnormal cell migration protein 18-like fibronectin type I domain-containing protein n=1 Tax=Trichostrongylus colubriformis TaxID=6319 RepID=A0AAN8ER63_TRICO
MERAESELSGSMPSSTTQQLSEELAKENQTRKMSIMTMKLMQLFWLYLCLGNALTTACLYEGRKYSNGETWVEAGMKLKCTITDDGGWSIKGVGCVTQKGTEVCDF